MYSGRRVHRVVKRVKVGLKPSNTQRSKPPLRPHIIGCNALEKRIHRLVREVIREDQLPTFAIPGLSSVFKSERSISFRIAWLLVILACFALCTYQGVERLQYFLSYPVAVDVNIDQVENLTFPAISICVPDFEILADRFLTKKVLSRYKQPNSCQARNHAFFYTALNGSAKPVWKSYLEDPPEWVTPSVEGLKNVSIIEENFLNAFGFCKTFKINETFRFRGHLRPLTLEIEAPSHCRIFRKPVVTVHGLTEKPLLKQFFYLNDIQNAVFSVESRKYVFLKRPGALCTDADTFSKCMDICYDRILKSSLYCGHLFLSPELKVPFCSDMEVARKAYTNATEIVAKIDSVTNCSCPRVCIQNNFFATPNVEGIEKNTPSIKANVLSFIYQYNYLTSLIERRAYTSISLLCDIGGNLGLFLGLSLLSLCELFQIVVNNQLQKKKRKKIQHKALHQKIESIYKSMTGVVSEDTVRMKATLGIGNVTRHNSLIIQAIWTFILVCNFVGTVYLIYNRTAFYFKTPITKIVEVVGNGSVQFPSLILCHESVRIANMKIHYASHFKLKSRCTVPFLDLLAFSDINATTLWDLSFAGLSRTTVVTPYGICSRVDFGTQLDSGRNAALKVILRRLDSCYEVQRIYITPPGELFDWTHYRHVPVRLDSVKVGFIVKEYNVRSTTPDCLETSDAVRCKIICLQKRLSESGLQCRLPYMPKISLPECSSPSTAKNATNTFYKVYLETHTEHHCGCQKQCSKLIYESRVRIVVKDTFDLQNFFKYQRGQTRVSIIFESIYKEIIFETLAYTFIKLVCDIGGNLGLALGLSVLSILDVFGIAFGSFFTKPTPRKSVAFPTRKLRVTVSNERR